MSLAPHERSISVSLTESPEISGAPHDALPWDGRDADSWQRLVKPAEAGRLIRLVQQREPEPGSPLDPAVLERYGLQLLPQAYTDAAREELRDASMRPVAADLCGEMEAALPLSQMLQRLAYGGEGASRPGDLLTLLTTMRSVRTTPHAALYHNEAPRQPLPERAGMLLGWEEPRLRDVIGRYHAWIEELTNTLVPHAAARYDYFLEGSEGHEQAARLAVMEAALRFYWETAAIDPDWTVRSFILYASKSNKDRSQQVFDTRGMEIHPHWEDGSDDDALSAYGTCGDPTAEEAAATIAAEELMAVLRRVAAERPEESRAFELVELHGLTYKEAGAQLGRSLRWATYAIQVVRVRSQTLWKRDNPLDEVNDSEQAPTHHTSGRRPSSMWDHLAAQTYSESALARLPRFHRDLLLTAQQAAKTHPDRAGILDALQRAFPDLRRDTLRRHLQGADRLVRGQREEQRSDAASVARRVVRLQTARALSQLQVAQPSFWHGLTDMHRSVINHYFWGEDEPTIFEVARRLGVNQSTVSRAANVITRMVARAYDVGR